MKDTEHNNTNNILRFEHIFDSCSINFDPKTMVSSSVG